MRRKTGRSSAEYTVHLHTISQIIDRWHAGEISTAQKREQIAAENTFWYGQERRSPRTGEVLTIATEQVPALVAPPPDDDEEDEIPWWQR